MESRDSPISERGIITMGLHLIFESDLQFWVPDNTTETGQEEPKPALHKKYTYYYRRLHFTLDT